MSQKTKSILITLWVIIITAISILSVILFVQFLNKNNVNIFKVKPFEDGWGSFIGSLFAGVLAIIGVFASMTHSRNITMKQISYSNRPVFYIDIMESQNTHNIKHFFVNNTANLKTEYIQDYCADSNNEYNLRIHNIGAGNAFGFYIFHIEADGEDRNILKECYENFSTPTAEFNKVSNLCIRGGTFMTAEFKLRDNPPSGTLFELYYFDIVDNVYMQKFYIEQTNKTVFLYSISNPVQLKK